MHGRTRIALMKNWRNLYFSEKTKTAPTRVFDQGVNSSYVRAFAVCKTTVQLFLATNRSHWEWGATRLKLLAEVHSAVDSGDTPRAKVQYASVEDSSLIISWLSWSSRVLPLNITNRMEECSSRRTSTTTEKDLSMIAQQEVLLLSVAVR